MARCPGVLLLGLFVIFGGVTFGQQTRAEANSVILCDVLNEPDKHVDQEYVVSAVLVTGFEMGWLEDSDECARKPPLRAIRFLTDTDFKRNTKAKIYRKYNDGSKGKYPKRTRGMFRIKVEPYEKADVNDKRYEFQIRILKIESVDEARKPSSVKL